MALVDSRTGDLELSLNYTTRVGYSWVTNSRLRKHPARNYFGQKELRSGRQQ